MDAGCCVTMTTDAPAQVNNVPGVGHAVMQNGQPVRCYNMFRVPVRSGRRAIINLSPANGTWIITSCEC